MPQGSETNIRILTKPDQALFVEEIAPKKINPHDCHPALGELISAVLPPAPRATEAAA